MGLIQERRNSIANVLELCLSCTNLSILSGPLFVDGDLGHLMMTSSNGNIFRVTGHLCGEIPAQRPVTRSFDVFLDLRLNKPLSKQS